MPWESVIPAADQASFGTVFGQQSRPLDVGERPALLVVDMTREFVSSDYPTGWSPTGAPAAAATATLLEAARAAGIPVYFTRKGNDPNRDRMPAERGRWKRQGPPPVLPESLPPGDVVCDELTPRRTEIIIDKGSRPSAFFGTPLASYLTFDGVDTLIVTGMVTSGCVRASVTDAFQHNFRVVVPYDCVADRSQISHKVTLFDLHIKYADVVHSGDVLDYLSGLGRRSCRT